MPTAKKGMTIRVDAEELGELRASLSARRQELEKVREKMEKAGLPTFTADATIEVVDRCKVAIGDEPEDLFKPPKGVDPETGEVTEEDD
jgi:hypothetical protein